MPYSVWTGPVALPTLAKVIAKNGSGQSIPSGGVTVLTNWTELYDTASAFDPTAGVFTVPTTGYYSFDAQVVSLSLPQNINLFIALLVNGATYLQGIFTSESAGGASNKACVNLSGMARLTAGDLVSIGVAQLSGAPVSLYAQPLNNFLMIAQLL